MEVPTLSPCFCIYLKTAPDTHCHKLSPLPPILLRAHSFIFLKSHLFFYKCQLSPPFPLPVGYGYRPQTPNHPMKDSSPRALMCIHVYTMHLLRDLCLLFPC